MLRSIFTLALLFLPSLVTAQGIVASTTHSAAYPPKAAFDGDASTRWASVASEKVGWLVCDFGKSVAFNDIEVVWEAASAKEYDLQVSEDAKKWTTLASKKDGKPGEKVKFSKLNAKGRYFRIHCNAFASQHPLYSIYEVRFPGSEAQKLLVDLQKEQPDLAAQLADQLAKEAAAEQKKRNAEREKVLAKERVKNLAPVKKRLAELKEKGCKEIVFAERQDGIDGHWYANFAYYSFDENKKTYRDGGRLVKLNLETGKRTLLVDDPFGGVRDPVVHYDAKKILFSYRKGGTENYHLYEIDVDGKNLKQLTDGKFDDIEACYLPDGGIVFVSTRAKRWVQCWLTQVAVLYRCDADGKNIQQISGNVEHDNTPWVLPDGRLLYQRWEYIDRSQVHYHHLWTSNPDGTGEMVYYGNLKPGVLMIDAKPIPGTKKIVSIFSPGHGRREHRGTVVIVDPSLGPDASQSAKHIPGGGEFADPWAFDENNIMVAEGKSILLLTSTDNGKTYSRLPIYTSPDHLNCQEPRPIVKREREKRIPKRTNEQMEMGRLLVADVHLGRNMEGVKKGDIKKLLVIETLPKPVNFTGGMDPMSYGGTFSLERVLGTVPVEQDGSAHFALPALRSFFVIALDKDDRAVKRMQSFFSVMPGETTGCVGCHEQRTRSAPVSIDQRNATLAARRPPSNVEPVANCPDIIDFPRDIQPILDRNCVRCHDYVAHKLPNGKMGGPASGRVILSADHGPMFSHAYHTMTVRKLFSDNRNRAVSNYAPYSLGSANSRILDFLAGKAEKHEHVKASAKDQLVMRMWTELGSPYPGTYGALGCGSIGGYQQNKQINTDNSWPTTKAGTEVIKKKCLSCHETKSKKRLPLTMSDENGLSFWVIPDNDPRHKRSRHILFNLSRPEQSLLLLAPLAKEAGGFGWCGKPVFSSKDDPDYKTLLAMVEAGKTNLEEIKRFDMPGFKPRPGWIREMKRYGVLDKNYSREEDTEGKLDFREIERKYWESLWHKAK